MHLLIDGLITTQRTDLIDALTQHRPECGLATFDFLNVAESINEAVEAAEPDVIVVDAVWLHLAALLGHLLDQHGAHRARVVVAAQCVDQIFLAQLAHRGYLDCLDLSLPTSDLVDQLCRFVDRATLPNDRTESPLWGTIPLPPTVDGHHDTPRDEIDHEILCLLSVGMQDIDIAHIVHISPQTVKNRISAMLERSGLRNRTQLAWLHHNHEMADAVRRSLGYGRRDTFDHIAS
jgi:DNA-binding NarL/FixJ family response regulator